VNKTSEKGIEAPINRLDLPVHLQMVGGTYLSVVLVCFDNALQNLLVNTGSQSEIIAADIPCNMYTVFMKTNATEVVVHG
jgi:hypothetical protein